MTSRMLPDPGAEAPAPVDADRAELNRLRAVEEQLRLELELLVDQQNSAESASDAYFRAYDEAPVPLLILDSHGTICSANEALVSLLGRPRAAVCGVQLRLFVHAIDRSVWEHYLSDAWQSEHASSKLRFTRGDGKIIPTHLVGSPRRRGVQGKFLHLVIHDLSEDEATARATRKLVYAERKAREESESKDALIAMLSHELRTPLTPVLAAASAFKSAPQLTPDIRGVFAMIDRNMRAEARLIDDLLDATGLSRGKMAVVRQPLDLRELVRECTTHLAPVALDQGIAMETDWQASESRVSGDAVRLRQVFFNLLTNALKFSATGGHITVRSWNREHLIVVEVEDDGAGFETLDASRLFTAFEQRNAKGGLGLGLAICRGILDLHEGRIEAASRGLGKGARFTLELSTASDAVLPPEDSSAFAQPALSSPHVLLVEDDADTAEIMAELLEFHGFIVHSADSVQSALAVPIEEIDVIVSDLGLPDGSGLDLMREISKSAKRPAIALSGFGMADDIARAKSAGFLLHITKPVDVARLVSAIRSIT